jgi:hypothetical protein
LLGYLGDPLSAFPPSPAPYICAIYALAGIVQSRNVQALPYLLVLFAFGAYLPDIPVAGDGGYDLLMFAFILHVLFLHLPLVPSPLFFFNSSRVLPLSVLLKRNFTHSFLPALSFFFPALFLSSIVLSISLNDVLLRLWSAFVIIKVPGDLPEPLPEIPPIEARTGFLVLYFALNVLFVASLVTLVLNSAATSSSYKTAQRWDCYGIPVGRDARRALVAAVARYTPAGTSIYAFPVPLNLLVAICVRAPAIILQKLRLGDGLRLRAIAERLLWRTLVAPVAAITTLAWRLVDIAAS